ncbi:MAG: SH3 domain-containing protein [Bdellovibrionota bacterium]
MVRPLIVIASMFVSIAFAETTKLERTTVRSKPDATSKAVGVLPVGSKFEAVSESGGYTKIKFQVAGAAKEGYVATSQLKSASSDPLKGVGVASAKKSGYGSADVAAAIQMGIPPGTGTAMAASASAERETTVAQNDEMSDEFDSLPEDIVTPEEAAPTPTAKKKSDPMSTLNTAVDQSVQGDEEAKKKKAEFDKGVKNAKTAGSLRKAVDGDKNAEAEVQNDLADAITKGGAKATTSANRAKSQAGTVGDMSSVETLENMQFPRTDFSATSPFVSEGHLKSKTLK